MSQYVCQLFEPIAVATSGPPQTKKPVIILLPDACLVPAHYDALASCLRGVGYTVNLLQHPSVGATPPANGFQTETSHVRKVIVEVLEAEIDIVLVLHGYGGIVGCAALEGLVDLAGPKGQVVRVVAYASWLLPKGRCLQDEFGVRFPSWLRVEGDLLHFEAASQASSNDSSESSEAKIRALSQPQAAETLSAKGQYEAWREYPFTYITCEKDQSLPPGIQEVQPGARDPPIVRNVPFDRFAHIAAPQWIAAIIREAAGERFR